MEARVFRPRPRKAILQGRLGRATSIAPNPRQMLLDVTLWRFDTRCRGRGNSRTSREVRREGNGASRRLLPIDERFYTVYFAAFPVARFDSHRRVTMPLPKESSATELSPSPRSKRGKSLRNVPGLKRQTCPRLHIAAPPALTFVLGVAGAGHHRRRRSAFSPLRWVPACPTLASRKCTLSDWQ